MIRFFPASKITLSGIRQANAKDMHSDEWDHVEIYTFGMTPHA
jgi:hypothetical protein